VFLVESSFSTDSPASEATKINSDVFVLNLNPKVVVRYAASACSSDTPIGLLHSHSNAVLEV
jgi:GH43 family beta-xylosidase